MPEIITKPELIYAVFEADQEAEDLRDIRGEIEERVDILISNPQEDE